MTQIYLEDGRAVPVTVIQAGPCHVLQVRSQDRDGYQAVQLGFEDKPRRLASRAERGHVAKLESKRSKKRSAAGVDLVAKAGCEPQRFIREFRGPVGDLQVGQELKVDLFADVKTVDITGTSKGRGTGGVRCLRFTKGVDRLVLAAVVPGRPWAASASGTPVDLPAADERRDGSGTPGQAPMGAVGL